MKEVFISYSSQDAVSAETVRDVLETNGLSCWMAPRDIPGGSNYTKEIPIAIRSCTVFVLILSQNAQNSHWVLKELDSAVNAGKVILPFMLEDCILNDEFNFLLTGAQRYAAYQKKAEALETLIRRIRSIMDTPDAPVEISARDRVAAGYRTDASCPSCRSHELKILPYRLKRHGIEIISMLLIPGLANVFAFIAIIICTFTLPYNDLSGFFWILLGSFLLGGFVGDLFSRMIVRRTRLRKRIHSVCYRCKRCRKVFRHDAPLDN